MYLLLFTTFLVVPTFALMALTKQRFFACLSCLFFGLIATGYVLASVGCLPFVRIAALGVFVVSLGIDVYCVCKKQLLKRILSPEVVAFYLAAVVLWVLCRGVAVAQWDELSHWGLVAKYMYETGALYAVPNSGIMFMEYPPAMAILEYLGMQLSLQGWREDLLYYTVDLFIVALACYPLSKLERKAWLWALPVGGVLCVLGAGFYEHIYQTLLVDGIIGVLFAFVLLVWFLSPHEDVFAKVLFCLGLVCLTLTKPSGFGLACMAVLLTVGDSIFFAQASQPCRVRWLWRILPLALAWLAQLSWSLRLQLMQVPTKWQGEIELWAFLTGRAPAYRYDVLRAFVREVGALWPWALLFGALLLGMWCIIPSPKRTRLCYALIGLYGMAAVFLVSTLIGYLFLFSEGEALALASFSRYYGTMFLSVVQFAVAVHLVQYTQQPTRYHALCLLLAGALYATQTWACYRSFGALALHPSAAAAQTRESSSLAIRESNIIRAVWAQDATVYYISQQDDGYALMGLQYQLTPQVLQQEYSGIGSLYPQVPAATLAIGAEEWQAMLANGYDYVYIHNYDSFFGMEFECLFANPSELATGALLRVAIGEDGSVQLVGVDAAAFTLAAGYAY